MRTPLLRSCCSFVAILLMAGCATAGSVGTHERHDRSSLTRAQFAEMGDITAAEAIRRYQPRWLTSRIPRTMAAAHEPLRVYYDGLFFGDFSTLHQVRLDDLKQIQFVEASQATMRYGGGHSRGAIVVLSRRANPGN